MLCIVWNYSESKQNANEYKEGTITLPVMVQFVPGEILSLLLCGRQTVFTRILGVIGLASCNNATSCFPMVKLNPL